MFLTGFLAIKLCHDETATTFVIAEDPTHRLDRDRRTSVLCAPVAGRARDVILVWKNARPTPLGPSFPLED